MKDGGNLAGSQTLAQNVGLPFFVRGVPSGIVYQISAGRKDGCSARAAKVGYHPSRACRREPLLAEDAGFLFRRIFEFSDIFLGERES
jgi:hypothetical protein